MSQPHTVVLLGDYVVKPGLQPGTSRGYGSLPIEESDGSLQLTAVIAEFIGGQRVKRMLRLVYGHVLGRHRGWS